MSNKKTVELYDTTLRDGTQGKDVNLSIHDKLILTQKLDDFGVDYIEGGWPGSNPKDEEYFEKVKGLNLSHAQICSFGSTARHPDKVKMDNNLFKLIRSDTPVVTIFGKTWRFHSKHSLGLSDAENEDLIFNSIEHLKKHDKKVIFDAEHFFDGFKDDEEFALKMLTAAQKAGADILCLCDTNGGTLPLQLGDIVKKVCGQFAMPIGIHAHNDSETAVANSLVAVENGASHVQGTVNGLGERCGNANLCSIIPNLVVKMDRVPADHVNLGKISKLSHYFDEIMNQVPNTRAPFVGKSAFTHKGGIHVSSILKDNRMYEHLEPEIVGNRRHVIISDLSGQSNIRYVAKEFGLELPDDREFSKNFIQNIKSLEYEGFQFDGAEASFELLLLTELNEYEPFFKVTYAKVNDSKDENGYRYSESVLKVRVKKEIEHTAADGNGPVNALDKALRKALTRFYPKVKDIQLVDYKVRVLGEKNGTNAKVRVLVESTDGENTWSTVGLSQDIIEASLDALTDSINYKILKDKRNSVPPEKP